MVVGSELPSSIPRNHKTIFFVPANVPRVTSHFYGLRRGMKCLSSALIRKWELQCRFEDEKYHVIYHVTLLLDIISEYMKSTLHWIGGSEPATRLIELCPLVLFSYLQDICGMWKSGPAI